MADVIDSLEKQELIQKLVESGYGDLVEASCIMRTSYIPKEVD